MALYYYCEDFEVKSVSVTMSQGSCVLYSSYDSGDGNREDIYKKWLYFTLASAAPDPLTLKIRYWYETYTDGALTYSGYQTITTTVPAGTTSHSFRVDCKIERWMTDSHGDDGTGLM